MRAYTHILLLSLHIAHFLNSVSYLGVKFHVFLVLHTDWYSVSLGTFVKHRKIQCLLMKMNHASSQKFTKNRIPWACVAVVQSRICCFRFSPQRLLGWGDIWTDAWERWGRTHRLHEDNEMPAQSETGLCLAHGMNSDTRLLKLHLWGSEVPWPLTCVLTSHLFLQCSRPLGSPKTGCAVYSSGLAFQLVASALLKFLSPFSLSVLGIKPGALAHVRQAF